MEFKECLSNLKTYDLFMNRLGHTKSPTYQKENEAIKE